MQAGLELSGGFGGLDWAVVLGVLLLTTLVGHRMAGRQRDLDDFFLGGRSLPWPAVAASIVATEISAVTYVSLPFVVFQEGGNITYLQLGLIGSLIARMVVGYVLLPAYYERKIYSPYDYMGRRLGEGVRRASTALFSLGGVLGQAARVYLTGVVLSVILAGELAWLEGETGVPPLAASIAAIGLVAVAWTWMGGIATVVWTDAILFVLFLAGIGVSLWTVAGHLPGGLSAAFAEGWDAGKFRFLDTDPDPTKAYTLWVALFAASWGGVGSYGTDQLLAQRMFCCKGPREARRAVIASIAAMAVTFLVALVGVGLWAYYRAHPLSGAAAALYAENPDRIFPIFVTEVVPAGLKGLVIAGAFAAAISSLDSILAALSQTSLSVLRPSGGAPGDARRELFLSRVLVLFWGVLLCAAALGMQAVHARYDSILNLALAMATYTGGALVAGFFLAFLPLRADGSGYPWAAALSVLTVFAVVWHDPWARVVCWVASGVLLGAWALLRRDVGRGGWLCLGLALVLGVCYRGTGAGGEILAWPWNVPIGSAVALTFSLLLSSGTRAPEEKLA